MAKRNHSFLSKMFFAILFSFIIFGIFSLTYTFLIYFFDIKFNKIIAFFLGLFSFFILGFLSGNFLNKRVFLISLVNASIVISIILLIKDFKINNFYEIIKFLAYLLISTCGGILGLNFKPLLK